jgi:putative alpha-1,2-mannosidase
MAGRPWRTQELVREICEKFYSLESDGVCGNEDNGQMSAWYIFSAMGFYPVDPVGGEYIIGAPQLPEIWLTLGNGGKLFVKAKNLSPANKYVKSVTFNSKKIEDYRIHHSELAKGGELVFEMTSKPVKGITP